MGYFEMKVSGVSLISSRICKHPQNIRKECLWKFLWLPPITVRKVLIRLDSNEIDFN